MPDLASTKSVNFTKDLINKTYKTCGCILVSELDFINNTINNKYIQLCNSHFNKTQPINDVLKKELSNNKLNSNNLHKTQSINNSCLNFGKYKNKSFNYVFQIDKLYCYNLAFWKNFQDYKNPNVIHFINFIKTQITIN
jgi:hypothetical protein